MIEAYFNVIQSSTLHSTRLLEASSTSVVSAHPNRFSSVVTHLIPTEKLCHLVKPRRHDFSVVVYTRSGLSVEPDTGESVIEDM